MTTGKANTAGEGMMRAEAVPRAPLILIAEEQPAIRELLRWTLRLAGYDALVCLSRQAALSWREQTVIPEETPVVLLLDLNPCCLTEATDFVSRVRTCWQAASPRQPQIIVLTTHPQLQAELGTREHVLLKPFHVRDLLALIQQATAGASRSEDDSRNIPQAVQRGRSKALSGERKGRDGRGATRQNQVPSMRAIPAYSGARDAFGVSPSVRGDGTRYIVLRITLHQQGVF